MDKVIRNVWRRETGQPCERTSILRHDVHPEGLDVERLRFVDAGPMALRPDVGHVVSVHAGAAQLDLGGEVLALRTGAHAFVPPGAAARVIGERGAGLVTVSAASPAGSRGKDLLVRDEAFLAACATPGHSLRWILTPQYLSRRIFLHHDHALVGRLGDPVSWFHTTMFDVAGLPKNAEGESVFKMAYNSKTEINVCFDVAGDARVRMALHPYPADGGVQRWGSWQPLDGESSYHLNEASDGPDVEWTETNGVRRSLRNKHEVWSSGYVTLFCLFDPAPTGVERHKPGEYSDYEPLADVVVRPEYAAHVQALASLDEMVDVLSLAQARGILDAPEHATLRARWKEGRNAQLAIEAELARHLEAQGEGREKVIAPFRCPP